MDAQENAGLVSFLLALLGFAVLLPFFMESTLIPWPVNMLFVIPALFVGTASRKTSFGKAGLIISLLALCVDAGILYIAWGME